MRLIYLILCHTIILNVLVAQTFRLDSATSTANWTGYGEIGNFQQSGSINFSMGKIEIERDNLKSGEIDLDMSSIYHEDKNLRKHLLAKDFFAVKKYPKATFKLTKWDRGIAYGILIMKGITKEITVPLTVHAAGDKIHLEGTAIIDRTQFGIKYNSSTYFQDLGNYAKMTLT